MSTTRLSSTSFNNVDILKIIKSVNVNKAHGHNDVSVRMIDCVINQLLSPHDLYPKIILTMTFFLIQCYPSS